MSASCTSTKKLNYKISTQKHNPEELKRDLKVLKEALIEAHPGLYWYVSGSEVDSIFNEAENKIDKPLTSSEFYKLTVLGA